MIDALFAATFGISPQNSYEAEVSRTVERVVIDRLMALASSAQMPQVRAVASMRLEQKLIELSGSRQDVSDADAAHYALVVRDISRFLERPAAEFAQPATVSAPPGAPIGQPAMEWLMRVEPQCSW